MESSYNFKVQRYKNSLVASLKKMSIFQKIIFVKPYHKRVTHRLDTTSQ